jgi:hypothetical protein
MHRGGSSYLGMRVTIEVGVVQELCYLLDAEIDTTRESRDILAAIPPERKVASGSHSDGEYVKWCEEDIAAYTAIRESLAEGPAQQGVWWSGNR